MLVFSVILAVNIVAQNALPIAVPASAPEQLALRSEKSGITRQRIGLWTLAMRRDPFASTMTCTIDAPRMTFDHGALAVRFGAKNDTFDAVYRIDGGARVEARSDSLELAHLGLPIYQEDLANASGGLVRIPAHRVRGAQRVDIELHRGGHVYTLKLSGLDEVLLTAQQHGCEKIE